MEAVSYTHLDVYKRQVLQRNENIDTINLMAKELNRLYTEYVREYAKFKKFYPNIIVDVYKRQREAQAGTCIQGGSECPKAE